MKKVFIGIDVSKDKVDACIIKDEAIISEEIITNNNAEIKKFFEKIIKEHTAETVLTCAEHTSIYTYHLKEVSAELGLDLWLENPYQLKCYSDADRGKNDKKDAKKIAIYCQRFKDKAQLFSLPDKVMATLKLLITEREMYMKYKQSCKAQLTDQKNFMSKRDYEDKKGRLEGLIKELESSIKKIDEKMQELIKKDDTLSKQHKLISSVEGVGSQTATRVLVETNAFRDFTEGRKFCCHVGVAPFEYVSGSSVKSSRAVSKKAAISIKSLLHMCSMSVIRNKDSVLKKYFDRKVAEGKNGMAVLNAIKGKLIMRIFAVIRDDRMYDKQYNKRFVPCPA
jgi:transposase